MFIDSQHKASSLAVSLASSAFIWNSFFLLHEKNPATLLFAFRFFGVGILWILSISEGCTWRFTLVLTLQSTSIKFSYLAFGAALISILLRREYFFTCFYLVCSLNVVWGQGIVFFLLVTYSRWERNQASLQCHHTGVTDHSKIWHSSWVHLLTPHKL